MTERTPELEAAIKRALIYAKDCRHEWASTEHLFLSLLEDPLCARAILSCGGDLRSLNESTRSFIETEIDAVPEPYPVDPEPSLGFERVIQIAEERAASSEVPTVNPLLVLISFYKLKNCYSVYLLRTAGVTSIALMRFYTNESDARQGRGDKSKESTTPQNESAQKSQHSSGKSQSEAKSEQHDAEGRQDFLKEFTTCLTSEARRGRFDPMIGRKQELERAIHILCSRRKNNPIFVGDSGVGKTAIVEGLAFEIAQGNVPEQLKNVEIYSVEIGGLLAGTRYRGDFEQRLRGIINALMEKSPNAILFVDEIHTLLGSGTTEGNTVDAASLLKPALARGELRCIGATTWNEYRQVFLKDQAFARRFQKIDVDEPSQDEAIQILKGVAPAYAEFHGVQIPDDVIERAVRRSAHLLQDRKLPDKAIDIIDESATAAKLAGDKQVSLSHVDKTISLMAKIPQEAISQDEHEALANLESNLKSVIYGQDEAVSAVADAVIVARAGLSQPDRPLANLLFTGPTGVGKTELARQLAKILNIGFIRFDMSEFSDRHTASGLIGSAPGLVGSENGGRLTEAVNKTPHAVLLLDEMEKADQTINNLFLQVMSAGVLTDQSGKRADFRNIILIMTSNVGSHDMERSRPGFVTDSHSAAVKEDDREYREAFAPEFRNRLDKRVRFAQLQPEHMLRIFDKFLRELNDSLAERSIQIEATNEVRDYFARRGYSPKFGARPMGRLITDELRQPIARALVSNQLPNGRKVTLRLVDGKLVFDGLDKTSKLSLVSDASTPNLSND